MPDTEDANLVTNPFGLQTCKYSLRFPSNLCPWHMIMATIALVRVSAMHSILSIDFPFYLSGSLDLSLSFSHLYIWHINPFLFSRHAIIQLDADVTTVVSSNKLESNNSVSFFTTSPRGAHYCLYIHWLADWIENWNSSQSETQFYASGSGFEFSNTNIRESGTSETENLDFKCRKLPSIQFYHQLSFE